MCRAPSPSSPPPLLPSRRLHEGEVARSDPPWPPVPLLPIPRPPPSRLTPGPCCAAPLQAAAAPARARPPPRRPSTSRPCTTSPEAPTNKTSCASHRSPLPAPSDPVLLGRSQPSAASLGNRIQGHFQRATGLEQPLPVPQLAPPTSEDAAATAPCSRGGSVPVHSSGSTH